MFSAKPPTPARLEQWSRLRAAGKRHFILYYGLLKIGTYLFVVLGGWLFLMETGLILLLMGGTDLPVPLPLPGRFWQVLLAIAILCYSVGYLAGSSRWSNNEEWYQYYSSQQQHRLRHGVD